MTTEQGPAQLALTLIESRRTLVLSTAGEGPWAAPVYYLFRNGAFVFFSSPKSRHILDALASSSCAAAVFRDGDDWRDIEGLQMEGAIREIAADADALGAFDAYVARFPTVRSFFEDSAFDLAAFCAKFRARMYAFTPARSFYLNNRAGFGSRVEIELPR
jgi:uncharacterized protein YhbP (UPF0306 family)